MNEVRKPRNLKEKPYQRLHLDHPDVIIMNWYFMWDLHLNRENDTDFSTINFAHFNKLLLNKEKPPKKRGLMIFN